MALTCDVAYAIRPLSLSLSLFLSSPKKKVPKAKGKSVTEANYLRPNTNWERFANTMELGEQSFGNPTKNANKTGPIFRDAERKEEGMRFYW